MSAKRRELYWAVAQCPQFTAVSRPKFHWLGEAHGRQAGRAGRRGRGLRIHRILSREEVVTNN